MNIHKLLKRQMQRSSVEVDVLPRSMANWQEFINKINKYYFESDEERYLLERSMEVSSREILELNEKLLNAQHIAKLGYWQLNTTTGRLHWSKELRCIMGLKLSDTLPSYTELLEWIHPDFREKFKSAINNAINMGEPYDMELKIKAMDGLYHWHHSMGAPLHGHRSPYTELAGVAMDITSKKETEEELRILNEKIILSAREAGMADVAVSVLHNVGNILNSVNVSGNILIEALKKSHAQRFFEICKMLNEHKGNLTQYLLQDEKGKLIPEYLIALGEMMQQNYTTIGIEIENINEKIKHIHDVIVEQQLLTKSQGIFEKIDLREAVKTSLLVVGCQLEDKGIVLKEEYGDTPLLFIEKSKLTQILVNLLLNARDSLMDVTKENKKEKWITLRTQMSDTDDNKVCILVQDNGMGISSENADKIFTYGFSTKRKGHGVGLHSSALNAQFLKGSLRFQSVGEGQGATFILELPISQVGVEK